MSNIEYFSFMYYVFFSKALFKVKPEKMCR